MFPFFAKILNYPGLDTLLSLLFPAASFIFFLGLGLSIYLKNRKSTLNQLFFAVSLCASFWTLGSFMMFRSSDDQIIIFWDRVVYLGIVFVPTLQYHFSLAFTRSTRLRQALLIIGYCLSFLFLVASQTDYFVAGVFHYQWGAHTIAQSLHHLFVLFFLFYVFALLYNLLKHYRKVKSQNERSRLVYLIIGFVILDLVGGLGFLPAYQISIFSPISLAAPLIFSIIVAYAIIHHRLMGIHLMARFIGKSLFVFALTTLASSLFLSLVYLISSRLWQHVLNFGSFLTIILLTTGFILLFAPLLEKIKRLADRLFLKKYNPSKIIREFNQALQKAPNLKTLLQILNLELRRIFQSGNVKILIFRTGPAKTTQPRKSRLRQSYNCEEIFQKIPFENTFVCRRLIDQSRIIVRDELKAGEEAIAQEMYRYEAYLIVPLVIRGALNSRQQLISVIILGSKAGHSNYTQSDLYLLENMQEGISKAIKKLLSSNYLQRKRPQ